MKKIIDFVKSALTDERGIISHKRIISVLCFVVIAFALIYKIFCTDCADSDPELVNGLIIICCVAMGATSFDKFSIKPRKVNSDDSLNEQEEQ